MNNFATDLKFEKIECCKNILEKLYEFSMLVLLRAKENNIDIDSICTPRLNIEQELYITAPSFEASIDINDCLIDIYNTDSSNQIKVEILHDSKLTDHVLNTTKEVLIEFIDINILPKLKKH